MVQQLARWWSSLEPSEKEKRNHRKRFVCGRLALARLFGTEKNVQVDDQKCESYLDKLGGEHQARWYRRYVRRYVAANGFFAGRLHFFPTFFDQVGLEVINPHDRKTGVGARGPILIECVPQGTTGEWVLLYVPFGPLAQSEDERRAQVAQDLEVLAQGIQAMLTTYGFGAKTSSGFGVAQDTVENGTLALNIPNVVFPQEDAPQVQKPDDEFLKYLDETGQVKPVFTGSGEGGLLSNSKYKKSGAQAGGGSLSEFKKFRDWYMDNGEAWQAHLRRGTTPTDESAISFESLSQLLQEVKDVHL